MRIIIFLTFLWSSLFTFTQQEIDLLNATRKNTSNPEIILLIDTLLAESKKDSAFSKLKSHLPKTSTVVKAGVVSIAALLSVLVAIEMISMLMGNELLLKNTKKLYKSACSLREETKEVSDEVKQLSDDTNSLQESVRHGVDKTEDIAEEVHELAKSLDFKENLARNDVELFRRIEVLEERLAAQNGDAFISLSEALNLSPSEPSTPVTPGTRSRSNTLWK